MHRLNAVHLVQIVSKLYLETTSHLTHETKPYYDTCNETHHMKLINLHSREKLQLRQILHFLLSRSCRSVNERDAT